MFHLHDELSAATKQTGCRICAYLATLTDNERETWQSELALPVNVIGHTAVVNALRKRGVAVTETSVRRHRTRHA